MTAHIQHIHQRWQALREARQPYDVAWQELATHFLPTRYRAEQTERKPLLNGNLIDATVRAYLDEVSSRMRAVLHRSNFYNVIHSLYADLGTFGTAFVFEVATAEGEIRFIPLTAGEYALDTDALHRVDTVFRRMHMTARQMAQFFGADALPDTVRRAMDRGLYKERFGVMHAVFPHEEAHAGPNENGGPWNEAGHYAPFRSVYWMDEGQGHQALYGHTLLREGGFCEFPGFGPRWDCPGNDVYGRSPAMDILPDCRMLQQMGITTLKSLHKSVDPPMSVSATLKSAGLDLTPGALNYVEAAPGQSPQAATPLVHSRPDIAQARQAMEAVQKQIKAGLHNDLFRLIMDGRNGVTAREIAAREEEKLILIGPVLERLHNEMFTPLIHRTYCLMKRLDMLPPRPPVPEETFLHVEFVSLLAQAQKLVSTSAVDQYLAFASNAARAWPEVLDSVDVDRVADSYADYLGLETSLLRSPEERRALRAARGQ